MKPYLDLAEILVAVLLVLVILLQVKGIGSGVFGQAYSSFRSRRGLEKTLFQFTIVLAFVFLLLSILSVRTA